MKRKQKTGRVLLWLLAFVVVLGIGGAALLGGNGAPEAQALSSTTKTLYVARNEAAGLYGDVILIANGSQYVLYLPGSADASKLCFSWASSVTVKDSSGTVMTSGKAPIAAPGSTVTYTVGVSTWKIKTVQGSPDVQAMFLNVDTSISGFYSFSAMNSSSDKSKSAAGTMTYGETGGYYFSIKGRGNSTWTAGYAKKPYNITLYKDDGYVNKKDFELIDGVKAKKWSLLANYSDSTLLRNKLGYDMALQMGIGLESVFVDLYADGEYLGTYLMTPKSDYESPENGYMLEIDNYTSTEDYQFTLDGMGEYHSSWYGYQNRISVKDNESQTPNADIEAYMQKAWKAMLDTSSEDYLNYIDLDSWAKFYILHEFYKSFDVVCGSILMYREGTASSDKLIAGPVWDLDNAMGRTNNNADLGLSKDEQHSPDGWYIPSVSDPEGRVETFWLQQLGKHESFMTRVYEIYHQYSYVFDGAAGKLDTFSAQLKDSAAMNVDLLGQSSGYAVSSADDHGCVKTVVWSDYVKNLRNYAVKRAAFLKENVPAVLSGTLTITGKAEDGATLTANVAGANATDLTYTWKCGTRTVTGKTFTWKSGEYGKPVTCTVTSSSMDGSLTVTLNAVTVNLSYAGGTGGVGTVKVYSGLPYGTLPTPAKDGFEFTGWFTGPNGTGTKVTADTVVAKTTAHNLYAAWKQVESTEVPTTSPAPAVPGDTTQPTEVTAVPSEPTDETIAPTDGTTAPTSETTSPADGTVAPTDGTAAPTDDGETVTTGGAQETTEGSGGTTSGEPVSQEPGSKLNVWYILVPAGVLVLLLILLLVLKKRKKA